MKTLIKIESSDNSLRQQFRQVFSQGLYPIRVTDQEADRLVKDGWTYCPKSLANKNLRLKTDDLIISVRSANRIEEAKITTVIELVTETEESLRHRGLGTKTIKEIQLVLNEMKLSLGMYQDSRPRCESCGDEMDYMFKTKKYYLCCSDCLPF